MTFAADLRRRLEKGPLRLDAWMASLRPPAGEPKLPPGGADPVDAESAAGEATILALRLDTGLALDDAEAGPLAPHLGWALDAGLLERSRDPESRVRLTTRGRLLSNELFSRLV